MKLFLTLALFTIIVSAANAKVHIVTCQNTPTHFLPVTVNAMVGDTIHWTWVAGVHIVGPINPTDIPIGAATWNGPIDFNNTDFEYVVTVAGNYHYVCHPSTPHAEDGYIVVTNPTGIQQNNAPSDLAFAYPNPAKERVLITFNSESYQDKILQMYDLTGRLVYQTTISNKYTGVHIIDVSLQDMQPGMYMIYVIGEGQFLTNKLMVY